MTQDEFVTLTGAPLASYQRADAMYNLTSMEKEDFCAEWKNGLALSNVAEALCDIAYALRRKNESLQNRIKELEAELYAAKKNAKNDIRNNAEYILLKASQYNDDDMDKYARVITGCKDVVKIKLQYKMQLNDEDMEWLQKYL